MRISRDPEDEIAVERGSIFEVTLGCEPQRLLLRLVKVTAVFD